MKFGRKGEEAEGKGKEVKGKEKGSENWVDDLQRTVIESKDSAIRSARSFHENSSTHLHSLQDRVPHAISFFKTLEDTFVKKVKDELLIAKEHPGATVGIAAASALLLMRGPRRFLIRQTLGRFQTEEGQFLKAEKNVKECSLSVDMMKNESKKLLERTALAEKDMKHGLSDLLDAGRKIQHFSKSVYKVERQASDLMDGLRQIPGREALQLRAEVASTISLLKKQRSALDKRIVKISDLGVPV